MLIPKLLITLLTFSWLATAAFTPSALAADATIKADRAAVDTACAQEAQTAGCGKEVVGQGLLKCIFAYKRKNKSTFTLSAGCKSALQTLRADKKAGK